MIYSIKGIHVVAEAENANESAALLQMSSPKEQGTEVKIKRVYTRRIHAKECPFCHKIFRGNRGVGIHKWKIHGVRSAKAIEAWKKLQPLDIHDLTQKYETNATR